MKERLNKNISPEQFLDAQRNVKKLLHAIDSPFPRGFEERRIRLLQYFMLAEIYETNFYYDDADKHYREYIRWSTRYLTRLSGSDNKIFEYIKEAYIRLGRRHFHEYCIALEFDRPFEKKFYLPRITVLKPIADDIESLHDGSLDMLSISLPPRVGKTTLGMFTISWFAGMHPMEHILAVGYSTPLVKTFYDAVKSVITDEEYLFARIFPESPLVRSNADYYLLNLQKDDRYATCTFRSIDASLTGAVEASSLAYIDDIVSGVEEAMNPDRMEKLWTKVTVDFMQRVVNSPRTQRKAPILLIGTRWSTGDALTRFEAEYGTHENIRYKSYRVPALDEYGASNFDFGNHAAFNTDYYMQLKELMDEVSWETVYQQNPIERLGLLFNEKEMKFCKKLPPGAPEKIVAFCDVAFGGKDSTSMPIAYMYPTGEVFIADVFFQQGDYQVTVPAIASKLIEHQVDTLIVESNNGGMFVADKIRDEIKGKARTTVRARRTVGKTSKEARIVIQAPTIKSFIFLDKSVRNPMYKTFFAELLTFKMEGKNKHDDAADSLSLLASDLVERRTATIKINNDLRGYF